MPGYFELRFIYKNNNTNIDNGRQVGKENAVFAVAYSFALSQLTSLLLKCTKFIRLKFLGENYYFRSHRGNCNFIITLFGILCFLNKPCLCFSVFLGLVSFGNEFFIYRTYMLSVCVYIYVWICIRSFQWSCFRKSSNDDILCDNVNYLFS